MKFPIKWNEYTIRLKKPSDAKEHKKLMDSLIDENADIGSNKKESIKKYEQSISKAIKGKKNVSLVAFKNNKMVGGTGISLKNGKADHVGSYGISVLKTERGKGLGKKLTELIIELAKKKLKGLELIELEVFKRNVPAINLYTKIGFSIVAELHKTLKVNNEYFDEYIMHYWIK
ncbi:MAG: GNAT family N-acetyltransferase [Candidatus Nanoarchaeia archaeon]|nr:GNAT family N-acetyltransferase [Candidatus Nanoarchaeia archaeon]